MRKIISQILYFSEHFSFNKVMFDMKHNVQFQLKKWKLFIPCIHWLENAKINCITVLIIKYKKFSTSDVNSNFSKLKCKKNPDSYFKQIPVYQKISFLVKILPGFLLFGWQVLVAFSVVAIYPDICVLIDQKWALMAWNRIFFFFSESYI